MNIPIGFVGALILYFVISIAATTRSIVKEEIDITDGLIGFAIKIVLLVLLLVYGFSSV